MSDRNLFGNVRIFAMVMNLSDIGADMTVKVVYGSLFILIKRGDNMIDFNEKLAKKEGRVTPKALLEDTLNRVNEINRIVMVIKDEEGIISTCYSDGMQLQALGMLEIGKTDIINDMHE